MREYNKTITITSDIRDVSGLIQKARNIGKLIDISNAEIFGLPQNTHPLISKQEQPFLDL